MKEKPSLRGKVNPSLALQYESIANNVSDQIEADFKYVSTKKFDEAVCKLADLLERLGIRKVRHECRCGAVLHVERHEMGWVVSQCETCERKNR